MPIWSQPINSTPDFQSIDSLIQKISLSTGLTSAQLKPLVPSSLNTLYSQMFSNQGQSMDHRSLIQNIQHHLEQNERTVRVLANQQQGAFHSFTPSLLTSFPGSSSETLLLVFPMPGPGQVGEFSPLVVGALSLIHFFSTFNQSELPYSIDILLAGSEYDSLQGSRYFLSQPNQVEYQFVLYIQDFGNTQFWNLVHGTRGEVTPGWLLEGMINHLDVLTIPFRVPGILTQLYLIGQGDKSPLEEYFRLTIPTLMFGFDRTLVGPFQFPSRVLDDFSLSSRVMALASFLLSPPEEMKLSPFVEWERQYILIQFEQFSWFLSESTVLIGTFLLIGTILIWLRVSRHRRRRYTMLLTRFWLTGIGLVITTFFIFILGNIIPQIILTLREYPDLWQFRTGSFFILTLLSGFALLGWVYSVFLLLVPKSHASVFSAIAVVTNLVAVFVLSLIQISVAYHYLWSLVCTMFFAQSKNRWTKWFWFLLSPFWLIKSLIEIFSLEQLEVLGRFIGINLLTNVLVAFMLVPFISMFLRLVYMNRNPIPRGTWVLLFSVLLGISTFLIIDLSRFQPFGPGEQPVQLQLTHSPTQPGLGILNSPAPLAWIAQEEFFNVVSPREWQIATDRNPTSLEVSKKSMEFLNRSSYQLEISLPPNTRQLSFYLVMEGDPIIFNVDFPFQIIPESREIEFFIGLFPPPVISMNLVVPIGSNPRISYILMRQLEQSDFWIEHLPDQAIIMEQVLGSFSLE
jgi:hypothetical protein